jgi:hypothetical protein
MMLWIALRAASTVLIFAVPAMAAPVTPTTTAFEISSVARDATAEELEIIKAGLKATLKDPYSAVVESARIKGIRYCAEVNAKNSFGGYVGPRTMRGMLAPLDGGLRAIPSALDPNAGEFRDCKKEGIY